MRINVSRQAEAQTKKKSDGREWGVAPASIPAAVWIKPWTCGIIRITKKKSINLDHFYYELQINQLTSVELISVLRCNGVNALMQKQSWNYLHRQNTGIKF